MDTLIRKEIGVPDELLDSPYFVVPREIFGVLAIFFTYISLIPQIVKICKTKKVDDISYLFLVMYTLSLISWFIYGIFIFSVQVIILELAIAVNMIILITLKIKYTKKQKNTKVQDEEMQEIESNT